MYICNYSLLPFVYITGATLLDLVVHQESPLQIVKQKKICIVTLIFFEYMFSISILTPVRPWNIKKKNVAECSYKGW